MPFKQDRMNSRERMKALLQGQSIDRVPLFPFILGFCARNVGYPIQAMYDAPAKSFDAQQHTLDQYGFDWGPMYGYASYGTWEFGGQVKMPTGEYEQAPMHTAFPVQSESDVELLRLPDVHNAGSLPLAMEFSRLQEKAGTPITVVLGGNFTIAGNICSVERLSRWMLRKPELAERILRLATNHIVEVVKYWAETFGAERVFPQIWEPSASNDIISPKQFERFVFPYLVESSKKILDLGIKNILYHICGEQNKNLPLWAQVPMGDPGICSFGQEVDIDKAIEHVGNSSIIAGNISPSSLQNDSPAKVYDTCKDAILIGRRAPRGFMLMPGCEVPPNSPPYNVYVMRKAVSDFGWYD
jgi:uroporphyrinogen decarboxylase